MIARPSEFGKASAPAAGEDSANRRHRAWAVHSIEVRALGLAGATLATLVLLGSQLAIGAHYSGELDATIAMLKMQPRSLQVAASQPALSQRTAKHTGARHAQPPEQVAR